MKLHHAFNGFNTKAMRILFVIRTGDIFPYFKSIVTALMSRGHSVRYLYDKKWTDIHETEDILNRFKKEHLNFEHSFALQRNDWWRKVLFHTRELLSYRMYLKSKQSPYYERRWLTYLPKIFQRLFKYKFFRILFKTAPAGWILQLVERITPPDKRIISHIRSYAPDVVVVNPTHARASSADLEYLKAAHRLGVPAVLPVAGWDNLTTKGIISVQPDRLLAWNAVQREEAVTWHRTPENRIRIIGATLFDDWFSYQKPSVSKKEFCARYGLRKSDPIFLYLGSSKNMAENEVWLVERLHAALKTSPDARLRQVQFLVRPHPANYLNYEQITNKDIAVTPKGSLPKSKEVMQSFYDAVYHTTAAIGINSSSMLMAIIAGKPVLTVLTDKYRKTQEETQHFKQLMKDDVLDWAVSDGEFVSAVKRLLDGDDIRKGRRIKFAEKFLRPLGLNVSAGEVAAQEIIAMAEKRK